MNQLRMHHIIYTSRATALLTPTDLVALIMHARHKNKEPGITGLLVYSGQQFVQLLEGECQVVKQAYERIRHDPRHTAVVKLADEAINARSFANWSMAFCEPTLKGFAQLALRRSQGASEQVSIVNNLADPDLPACLRELLLANG
jgi:hypothetical protein